MKYQQKRGGIVIKKEIIKKEVIKTEVVMINGSKVTINYKGKEEDYEDIQEKVFNVLINVEKK